jgi:uncharacterized membrane protein
MPSETALQQSKRCQIGTITYAMPFQWLARGWWDMLQRPVPALVHGAVVALFGIVLLWVAHRQFWLLAGAFSGFLLIGPLAATGLYAVSRAIERGHEATLGTALAAWRPRDHRLVLFGVLLAAAGTCWVLTSASLITAFAPRPVLDPIDFLHVVVIDDQTYLFEAWLALGGVLVAPVYASSVVAIPLLLERRIGVLAAVLTSWRAVMQSPGPMALWGALLLAITFIGMSTLLLGLVVAVPWLSYASWHAYRDLVPSTDLPEAS